MKNKLITITAMLAVMVAMTGIAAAVVVVPAEDITTVINGTNTVKTSTSLNIGGTSTELQVLVTNIVGMPAGTSHNMTVELYDKDLNPTTGLEVTITELTDLGTKPTGIFPTDSPIVIWKQDTATGPERFDLAIKDIAGVQQSYGIKITDTITGKSFVLDATTISVSVPEFPTVALPVAAVIGLVFLFQNRKNKKE